MLSFEVSLEIDQERCIEKHASPFFPGGLAPGCPLPARQPVQFCVGQQDGGARPHRIAQA
jgi:hypothetical protein